MNGTYVLTKFVIPQDNQKFISKDSFAIQIVQVNKKIYNDIFYIHN